ncbi:arylsulfatase A family protein [Striga asiatica]|uniref:Arylsulfatase A family protein n=1 Tax=Striga asiatica TaxID=4170 RepID=A0A5A7NYT9_STRAF|nr:arylsulfatase A family protein [Striga asiatica]
MKLLRQPSYESGNPNTAMKSAVRHHPLTTAPFRRHLRHRRRRPRLSAASFVILLWLSIQCRQSIAFPSLMPAPTSATRVRLSRKATTTALTSFIYPTSAAKLLPRLMMGSPESAACHTRPVAGGGQDLAADCRANADQGQKTRMIIPQSKSLILNWLLCPPLFIYSVIHFSSGQLPSTSPENRYRDPPEPSREPIASPARNRAQPSAVPDPSREVPCRLPARA